MYEETLEFPLHLSISPPEPSYFLLIAMKGIGALGTRMFFGIAITQFSCGKWQQTLLIMFTMLTMLIMTFLELVAPKGAVFGWFLVEPFYVVPRRTVL